MRSPSGDLTDGHVALLELALSVGMFRKHAPMLIAGVVKAVIERVTMTDPMQQRRDETVLYCGREQSYVPRHAR